MLMLRWHDIAKAMPRVARADASRACRPLAADPRLWVDAPKAAR
ncbi:hypothetical protein [Paenibacillus xylaniclasticus]|nr:hypothetical protein [Paenibacillus xylaniclasticus]